MRKIGCVAALLLAVGCRTRVDVARETEALLTTDRAWAHIASTGGPPDSVLSYWTEDARVAMTNEPVLRGKAALRQMVTSSLAIPGFRINWTPESAVVAASADLGYTVGTNELSVPDSTGKVTKMVGRYLTVWRREPGGRWRCVEDYTSPGPVAQKP